MTEKVKKKLTVNNIDFAITGTGQPIYLRALSEWYLVFKAIEGEKLAEDLLNVSGIVVYDINGHQIWPVLEVIHHG